MGMTEDIEILRHVPMFARLEATKLKLLAFASESLTFADGEVLFEAGDEGDGAYVVMDGAVDIVVPSDGELVIVASLQRHELFGELAAITHEPRNATIRAQGEVRTLRISEDLFLKLLAENPTVALDVIRQLSVKLQRTHRDYELLRAQLQNDA